MPSSKGSNWFITVSTQSEDDVDLSVVEMLVVSYPKYYCVRETGLNGGHPHFHAAVWSSKIESQEVIRKRWIKMLKLEEQKRAVTVKQIDDGNRLIGCYLQKDPDVKVLHSNLEEELLVKLKAMYKKVEGVVGGPKVIRLEITTLCDQIIKFSKVFRNNPNHIISGRDDLDEIVQAM